MISDRSSLLVRRRGNGEGFRLEEEEGVLKKPPLKIALGGARVGGKCPRHVATDHRGGTVEYIPPWER